MLEAFADTTVLSSGTVPMDEGLGGVEYFLPFHLQRDGEETRQLLVYLQDERGLCSAAGLFYDANDL